MTRKHLIRAIGWSIALLALANTGCSLFGIDAIVGALTSIFGGAGIVAT